jgi:pimeloyl-ACP methyl ester carboxylesterase
MAYLQAGEVRLEYFDVGDGERTIVLIHGASSSARIWHSVQQRLGGSGVRTVAISMRGAGGSDHTPSRDDYNPKTYARDLSAALKALTVESFVLVGHSLGVATALSFMKEHASQFDVQALGLMAGGAAAGRSSPTQEEVRKLEESLSTPPSEDEATRRARWEPNHLGLALDIRDALWRDIQNNPIERTIGQRIGERPDMTGFLAALEIPTLVIGGDADGTVPIETTLQGYLSLPIQHRHLHIFHGVSHFPNAHVPDELAHVLVSFVAKQVPELKTAGSPA